MIHIGNLWYIHKAKIAKTQERKTEINPFFFMLSNMKSAVIDRIDILEIDMCIILLQLLVMFGEYDAEHDNKGTTFVDTLIYSFSTSLFYIWCATVPFFRTSEQEAIGGLPSFVT